MTKFSPMINFEKDTFLIEKGNYFLYKICRKNHDIKEYFESKL